MSLPVRSLLAHLQGFAALTVPDATLLARWREQHDEAAFAALMARHGPMVLGLCRRVLGDVQHAEDVFQATFLVLARRAAQLRRTEVLASFLYTIALRLARKAHTVERRRKLMQVDGETPEPADSSPHPLDLLSGRELLTLLDAEVARLPEVYRLPLLLCVLQGRTIEKAASLLGWSIGSVRGRLTRGRERLRQRLRRRGLDLSVGALALLTPVALPERLQAECLRNLSAPVPGAIHTLAASSVSAWKPRAIGLGLLVLAALGLGASLALVPTPNPDPPAAPAPIAPPVQAKEEPRRDRYGDPLPLGAVARLGTLRFRAPGEIVALAFAPDNKSIVVSADGGLILMDPVSGERIKRLPTVTYPEKGESGSWGTENPIVISPDGKRLLSKGYKAVGHSLLQVVRVWDLAGEKEPREYDIGQWILWLGWSAENQPLAVRVEEGVLYLHDLATGRSRRFACKEPQRSFSGHFRNDPHVGCSPAGNTLAVADDKNTVHVWETTTGRERCTLQSEGDIIFFLVFSPDGSRLVSGTGKTGQMWDAMTGNLLYTVKADESYRVPLFSADGKLLAIAHSWTTISFWDAATGKELGRTEGKMDFAPSIALSPDGKSLVTAVRHGSTIHVWDVVTGKRKAEPEGHTNRPGNASFTPDGRHVATGGSSDSTIRIWDLRTGEPLLCLQGGGFTRACEFSPDGRTLFASWSFGGLELYDAAAGKRQHVIAQEDPERSDTVQSVISMNLSHDGKTLVALSYYYPK